MKSPSGWVEPGQTPEFDEYTVVLQGNLKVTLKDAEFDVVAGQAIIVKAGEWVNTTARRRKGPSTLPCASGLFARNRASGCRVTLEADERLLRTNRWQVGQITKRTMSWPTTPWPIPLRHSSIKISLMRTRLNMPMRVPNLLALHLPLSVCTCTSKKDSLENKCSDAHATGKASQGMADVRATRPER